jgi:surfactin synthase thioesterase subunit
MDFSDKDKGILDNLKKSECPFLLLVGSEDPIFSIEEVLEFREKLGKDVSIVSFAGGNKYSGSRMITKDTALVVKDKLIKYID